MANIANLLIEHMDIWTAAETKKKSGRGRASGNTGSVYGVKKLRELILELAVCGKLVPQDPNDEPASELLKRIKTDKTQLISEGKLRKEKPLASIGEDEKLFALPNRWIWVRNCELFQLRKGRIPKSFNEDGQGLPYLDIDALDRNILRRYSEELTCPQSTEKDILVVCDGSRSGLLLEGKNGIVGSTLSIIDTPIYIQNYIKLIFKQGFEIFNTSMKGAAIPHLDTKKLLQNPTALPPLAEQHRIVEKVDELMVLCDQLEQQHSNAQAAHETLVNQLLATLIHSQNAADFNDNWQRIYAHFDVLFTTEASIDAFKQTLLQLAVMGKLVPQDPNDEPASELLKRIQAQKAKLIADGKLKKAKPLAPIGDDEKPFELPQGWGWVRLNEAIDVRDGTHDSPKEASGEKTYPLVTSKDFNDGTINFDSAKRISADDHYEISKRSYVEKYDILFSMIGGNIGNQVMVTDVREFSVKNVALFKYYDKKLTLPMFVKKYTENLAYSLQTTAVGGAQPFVALGALRNLAFAIPPLAEQHRIVAKVDELMALCGQLKTRIQQAKQQQQTIAGALVAQAVA